MTGDELYIALKPAEESLRVEIWGNNMELFTAWSLLLLGFGVCAALLIAVLIKSSRLKKRWAFVEGRKNLQSDEWFQRYAKRLSTRQRASLVNLLISVTESTGVPWTKLRPCDLIGPHLFQQSYFDIENSWVLFSDALRTTEPDVYRKIETNWRQEEGGVRLDNLISLISNELATIEMQGSDLYTSEEC